MMLKGCKHESEVKQALESGQWPLACSAELRTHVDECPGCKQLVLLTSSFSHARTHAMAAAPMGSPGLIWWRAQLRRRNQAVERVTRPLLGAQIFSLLVMLLAGLGFVGFKLSQQQDPVGWLKALPHAFAPSVVLDASTGWLLPVVLVSALALFGGAVAYFSSDRS